MAGPVRVRAGPAVLGAGARGAAAAAVCARASRGRSPLPMSRDTLFLSRFQHTRHFRTLALAACAAIYSPYIHNTFTIYYTVFKYPVTR